MNRYIDYYKILQVHCDADQEAIDGAYCRLSKMYHPNVNKSPMVINRIREINIAYSVISDRNERIAYHNKGICEGLKSIEDGKIKDRAPQTGASDLIEEKKEEAAARVLDDFFGETVDERWEKVYTKLTDIDKANIPIEDFLEWKRAVSKVYKLIRYNITCDRKYENCDYAGVIYKTVFQFSVNITEMHIPTRKISEESTYKYVVQDCMSWHVCLGYTDLKPTIMKFKHLAQAVPKLDMGRILMKAVIDVDFLTGLYSRSGFLKQAENEFIRSQWYGNPISLAVIVIKPTASHETYMDSSYHDACISYVAETLYQNLEKADLIGRYDLSTLVILFTEMKLEKAKIKLNELIEECECCDYLNYEIYSANTDIYMERIDQIIDIVLENISLSTKEKETHNKQLNENLDAILGKHSMSNVLSFRRKGKNHF